MTAKTTTERVTDLRARRLALGLRRHDVYVHDEDWPAVRDLADSLTDRRVNPAPPASLPDGQTSPLPQA